MSILKILEELASTVHHQVDINRLIADQPQPVQAAFNSKLSENLRSELTDHSPIQADRSSIVNIPTDIV